MINNIRKSINKKLVAEKKYTDLNENDKEKKLNTMNIESIRNHTKLTLVEEIEELGFIPSIDKENDTNAA